MTSLRTWLVSGTFAAGLSAGMLCGAGLAAADTGGESGTANASAHATSDSPKAERGARRAQASAARPAAAAADRTPGARVNKGLTSKPATPAPFKAALAAAVRPAGAALKSEAGLNIPATAKSAASLAAPPAAAAAIATPAAAAKTVTVAPSSTPVDPAKYAGTYYEQGSVKQFFSIGLVNTSATYTLNPDGTIRVQNSGNYFFNRGPRSSIVGSAVPVNADNTVLNVGFSPFSKPSATPPGNYTILATAPDYSWAIVSDPSGRSGYILTRSKTISPAEYQQLLDQARSLGVQGRITKTVQYA